VRINCKEVLFETFELDLISFPLILKKPETTVHMMETNKEGAMEGNLKCVVALSWDTKGVWTSHPGMQEEHSRLTLM
jgi:hypothetical protein